MAEKVTLFLSSAKGETRVYYSSTHKHAHTANVQIYILLRLQILFKGFIMISSSTPPRPSMTLKLEEDVSTSVCA